MSLVDKVLELCSYDDEQEWFEFKGNWFLNGKRGIIYSSRKRGKRNVPEVITKDKVE